MFKGLLDFAATPEGQGLLSATFGGLATAQRGAPLNSIGRAGMAGIAGYTGALDRQQQQADNQFNQQYRTTQLEGLKLQQRKTQEELDREQRQRQWLASNKPQGLEQPGAAGGTQGAAPTQQDPRLAQLWELASNGVIPVSEYVQAIAPKERKLMTVRPGEVVLDERNPASPLFSVPTEKKKTSVEEMLDAAGITDPAMRQGFIVQALKKQTTHAPAPSANVVLRQEGEEAKSVGKFFGDAYSNIQNAAFTAQSKVNRYNRLSQLLEGVNTGKFAGAGLEVAKAASSFGFNIDPNMANKEAAQALSGEIALELRNPSGGAGMPGSMTDSDREFLVKMVPGLATTPEGRALMLDTAQKLAKRDIDVARIAREYRKRQGSIDEGFYDELSKFSQANPLFTNPAAAPSAANSGFTIRRVR